MSAADTSREQRASERLASVLGVAVREKAPEKIARSWRVTVEILRGDAVVAVGAGYKQTDARRSARGAWDEAYRELRAMARGVLSDEARAAGGNALWATREVIRCTAEVERARKALSDAEAEHAKAVAKESAATSAAHAMRATLPDDAARAVLDALCEVTP